MRPHRNYGLDIGDHPHIYSYLLKPSLHKSLPSFPRKDFPKSQDFGGLRCSRSGPVLPQLLRCGGAQRALSEAGDTTGEIGGWAAGFLPGKVTEKQWENICEKIYGKT